MAKDQNQYLIDYYAAAQKRLQSMILNPTGGTDASQEFRRARAASLISQVDQLLLQVDQTAAIWTGDTIPAEYALGRKQADQQIAEWGIANEGGPAGSLSLIDRRSLEVLARDSAGDLRKASKSMGDTTKSLLREMAEKKITKQQVNEIIAGGIIEGMPRAATRQLRDQLIKVNDGRLVTIIDKNSDPMTFDAAKYAETVVRTKTREAVETGRHERLLSKGISLVSITGRLSKYFCSAFLGQVFSIDGGSDKYPALSSLPGGGPPFHPNCSKSTRAFIADLASEEQLAAADGVDDAQKLIGMDQGKAQRAFQDLQLHGQVKESYSKLTPFKSREERPSPAEAAKNYVPKPFDPSKQEADLVVGIKGRKTPGEAIPTQAEFNRRRK